MTLCLSIEAILRPPVGGLFDLAAPPRGRALRARLPRSVAWLAMLLLAFCQSAWAESRVALVIGNGGYKSVAELANPPNDARDIGDALKALGFDVQIAIDADQARMQQLIADFGRKAAKADVSLFYYGGHGLQVASHNYLVPVDAAFRSVEDIDKRTVHFDDVLEAQAQGQGIHLIFLDACRNNPVKDLNIPAASSGLARVGDAAGFLIGFATQPDNVAYDGGGRNSPFAQALLGHIATPGLDVSSMMIAVRRDVIAATGGSQVPWENSSLTRQFYFAGPSAADASPELMLWLLAAEQHDRNILTLYLDRYPKGAHVEDARSLMAHAQSASEPSQKLEDDLWRLALGARERSLAELYLARYPSGAHAADAEALLASLRAADASAKAASVVCDRLATVPADATANAPGVDFASLAAHAAEAVDACGRAADEHPEIPHYRTLLARSLLASGRFDEAITRYRQAAEAGDGRAMVSLGLLMEAGDHMPKDIKGAYALYRQAADRGNADGAINLGFALAQGKFVDKDAPKALSLFEKASEAGSARATYDLAALISSGVGGKPGEALDLFKRAASLGEPAAHRAAAVLLDEGRNAPKDPNAAAEELLRCVSADSGDCLAELTGRTQTWSADTVKAIETRLKTAGYYAGPINGRSGPDLAPALKQWRLLGPPA